MSKSELLTGSVLGVAIYVVWLVVVYGPVWRRARRLGHI